MLKWTTIGLVALALPSFAGIRSNVRKLNELTIDGHSHGSGAWEVSSPTVACGSRYLTYDASGKSPKVSLPLGKGSGTAGPSWG